MAELWKTDVAQFMGTSQVEFQEPIHPPGLVEGGESSAGRQEGGIREGGKTR